MAIIGRARICRTSFGEVEPASSERLIHHVRLYLRPRSNRLRHFRVDKTSDPPRWSCRFFRSVLASAPSCPVRLQRNAREDLLWRGVTLAAWFSFAVGHGSAKATASVRVPDSTLPGLASMMPTWSRRSNSCATVF
jgi:hypothetical protein